MLTNEERSLQARGARLVRNEVYYCISQWMQYAIDNHNHIDAAGGDCPVDVDDIRYDEECNDCNGTGYLDVDETKECGKCENGLYVFEIFEWWAVSCWLAGKLSEHGEVVLENEYWGRQTTGQAISNDSVIESICKETRRAAMATRG